MIILFKHVNKANVGCRNRVICTAIFCMLMTSYWMISLALSLSALYTATFITYINLYIYFIRK